MKKRVYVEFLTGMIKGWEDHEIYGEMHLNEWVIESYNQVFRWAEDHGYALCRDEAFAKTMPACVEGWNRFIVTSYAFTGKEFSAWSDAYYYFKETGPYLRIDRKLREFRVCRQNGEDRIEEIWRGTLKELEGAFRQAVKAEGVRKYL